MLFATEVLQEPAPWTAVGPERVEDAEVSAVSWCLQSFWGLAGHIGGASAGAETTHWGRLKSGALPPRRKWRFRVSQYPKNKSSGEQEHRLPWTPHTCCDNRSVAGLIHVRMRKKPPLTTAGPTASSNSMKLHEPREGYP